MENRPIFRWRGFRCWEGQDDEPIQHAIDAQALPERMERAGGLLTFEVYMIRYGLGGLPEQGTVIGRLADERRALADINADL